MTEQELANIADRLWQNHGWSVNARMIRDDCLNWRDSQYVANLIMYKMEAFEPDCISS